MERFGIIENFMSNNSFLSVMDPNKMNGKLPGSLPDSYRMMNAFGNAPVNRILARIKTVAHVNTLLVSDRNQYKVKS